MSDFTFNTIDELNKLAEQYNCDIVEPTPTELQIDLDDIPSLEFFNSILPSFREQIGVVEKERWSSRSGNKHVILQLSEELPIEERLLIQACLGSDRKRELLNYLNYKRGSEHPIVLFRPKQKISDE